MTHIECRNVWLSRLIDANQQQRNERISIIYAIYYFGGFAFFCFLKTSHKNGANCSLFYSKIKYPLIFLFREQKRQSKCQCIESLVGTIKGIYSLVSLRVTFERLCLKIAKPSQVSHAELRKIPQNNNINESGIESVAIDSIIIMRSTLC